MGLGRRKPILQTRVPERVEKAIIEFVIAPRYWVKMGCVGASAQSSNGFFVGGSAVSVVIVYRKKAHRSVKALPVNLDARQAKCNAPQH